MKKIMFILALTFGMFANTVFAKTIDNNVTEKSEIVMSESISNYANNGLDIIDTVDNAPMLIAIFDDGTIIVIIW